TGDCRDALHGLADSTDSRITRAGERQP
ncbi:MAG: hypothetical protein QOE09_1658, partial [Ilumatobacteraceae bacterium]